jgi:hypothetical protein
VIFALRKTAASALRNQKTALIFIFLYLFEAYRRRLARASREWRDEFLGLESGEREKPPVRQGLSSGEGSFFIVRVSPDLLKHERPPCGKYTFRGLLLWP